MIDLLISSFLVSDVSANHSGRLPKMSNVSKLLRLFTKNEWPCAICSGCSPKMSKWANRTFFWANRSFANFFAKTSNSLRKPMSEFPALVRKKTQLIAKMTVIIINNYYYSTMIMTIWIMVRKKMMMMIRTVIMITSVVIIIITILRWW